jgi:hypothetical protein
VMRGEGKIADGPGISRSALAAGFAVPTVS